MSRFLTRRPPRSLFAPATIRQDDRLSRLMEDLLEESQEIMWTPDVEVVESDDEIELSAEMPGLSRDDIRIEVEDDILRIHGEKKEELEEERKDGEVRISERRYGAFSRSFGLPASVDADAIEAEMKNGVLTVRLPKTAQARGRRIEIEGD
ncbi:MAG: Hsp20/alpha crystallin family protein [Gemmatimonadota bacterium]